MSTAAIVWTCISSFVVLIIILSRISVRQTRKEYLQRIMEWEVGDLLVMKNRGDGFRYGKMNGNSLKVILKEWDENEVLIELPNTNPKEAYYVKHDLFEYNKSYDDRKRHDGFHKFQDKIKYSKMHGVKDKINTLLDDSSGA